jgi:hypothetical protein
MGPSWAAKSTSSLLLLVACTGLKVEVPPPEPGPRPAAAERVCGELFRTATSLRELDERPEAWALADLITDYYREWCE